MDSKQSPTKVRWGAVLVAVILTVVLLAACAPKPAPAPTVAPTAAPAATSHEKVSLDILGGPMGGIYYVFAFALADIINKNHPWLRGTGRESTGIDVNVKTLAMEPDKRKNTVVISHESGVHQAAVGDPPFEAPYAGLRAIARTDVGGYFFVTLNKDINTPNDFAGKKVGMGQISSTLGLFPTLVLRDGYGVLDKVKVQQFAGWAPLTAVRDGIVDIAMGYAGVTAPYSPIPALSELIAAKPVHFVGTDPEVLKRAREKSGYPFPYYNVPAGTYGEKQTNALGAWTVTGSYWCDATMDADIVYEITKTIYENVGKFGEYHVAGKSMSKDTLASIPIPEKDFHPGAVKFYKEKGLKVGGS